MVINTLRASDWLLVAALITSAVTDIRVGRIYNAVTYPAIVAGLAAAAMGMGPSLVSALLGSLVGGLALYALFTLRWMGGGDVKLMAVAGACLGFPAILHALFYSIFAGGVCAAIILIWRGQSRPAVQDLSVAVGRLSGLNALSLSAIPARGGAFPFGVAIAVGTNATIVLERLGMAP